MEDDTHSDEHFPLYDLYKRSHGWCKLRTLMHAEFDDSRKRKGGWLMWPAQRIYDTLRIPTPLPAIEQEQNTSWVSEADAVLIALSGRLATISEYATTKDDTFIAQHLRKIGLEKTDKDWTVYKIADMNRKDFAMLWPTVNHEDSVRDYLRVRGIDPARLDDIALYPMTQFCSN
jgi:hypothetical protein